LLHELDDVAARAAAEALEEAAVRVDVKRRRFFAVERAQSDQVIAALPKLDVRPDERADVVAREYLANRRLIKPHGGLVHFATREPPPASDDRRRRGGIK